MKLFPHPSPERTTRPCPAVSQSRFTLAECQSVAPHSGQKTSRGPTRARQTAQRSSSVTPFDEVTGHGPAVSVLATVSSPAALQGDHTVSSLCVCGVSRGRCRVLALSVWLARLWPLFTTVACPSRAHCSDSAYVEPTGSG